MRRTRERVFGAFAIVARIGLIAAVIAGVDVSSVVLILIPLVVIGWSTYHYVLVRPAPWGVKPPDSSDDHPELSFGPAIDCEEDQTLRAVLSGCCESEA